MWSGNKKKKKRKVKRNEKENRSVQALANWTQKLEKNSWLQCNSIQILCDCNAHCSISKISNSITMHQSHRSLTQFIMQQSFTWEVMIPWTLSVDLAKIKDDKNSSYLYGLSTPCKVQHGFNVKESFLFFISLQIKC